MHSNLSVTNLILLLLKNSYCKYRSIVKILSDPKFILLSSYLYRGKFVENYLTIFLCGFNNLREKIKNEKIFAQHAIVRKRIIVNKCKK